MVRVTNIPASKARRKKELKRAKGFTGKNKNTNRITSGVVKKSMAKEFVGRKLRKRDIRSLWVTRIGIACKSCQSSYSALISGFKKLGVLINRKMLAELAINDKTVFSHLVGLATAANK